MTEEVGSMVGECVEGAEDGVGGVNWMHRWGDVRGWVGEDEQEL